MEWGAISLTIRLALLSCAILAAVGIPIAYWLTFTRWRWKFLAQAVVALPLVLPPTVLGFYLLVGMGPSSPLGRLYTGIFGHSLPFTFGGLVFASVLYSLPFTVQPISSAFASVDRRLMDASSMLGASRLRTFCRVVMPLSINGLLTGIILSFAHTVGEFGVVLMVGGNIPGVTRTVSIAIYDDVQSFNNAAANHTALLLLVFSFVVLSMVYALNRRAWTLLPAK
ncbi:MAG: molybdate ABC transporter permease subunit [Candidatus Angelobacter sp. Gp1-AA117]|nr:MAG: molybdate ABC transporter permease subunit [Candidatus Angelobacter sp. Gp1-AA117]